MINESVIKKILFCKYLYSLAEENINTGNSVKLSTGIILLQDSVEIFLLGLAEHKGASIDGNTPFDRYFDKINERICPEKLPLQTNLIKLNKLRVNTKHYGIYPEGGECKNFLLSVGEFYEDVSINYFGKKFASITLIDLLIDGEAKEFLKEAIEFYENDRYQDCLINCRKAIYVEVEHLYNIEKIKDADPKHPGFFLFGGKAPFYALNKDYIEKGVGNPCDYIVLDHNSLEMELMQYGIEHNDFWNIWRLTPEVFRSEKDIEWVIKYEFNKFDESTIKSNAEYSLNKTIELILNIHKKKQSTKFPLPTQYYLELKSEEVKVFEKADKNSKVVGFTPKGLKKINTDFNIRGLNDNDNYWHINHIEEIFYIFGYIHEADVVYNR